MEFLRPFLRRHLAGKPVVASLNVDCFSGEDAIFSLTSLLISDDLRGRLTVIIFMTLLQLVTLNS